VEPHKKQKEIESDLTGRGGFFGSDAEADEEPRSEEGAEGGCEGVSEEAGEIGVGQKELESEDDQPERDDSEIAQGAVVKGAIGGKANKAAFEGDAKAKAENSGRCGDTGGVMESEVDEEGKREAKGELKGEGLAGKPRREGGFEGPQEGESKEREQPTAEDILGEVDSEVEAGKADR